MARMSEIEWEPCLLSQRPAPELERRFARETGRPGKMMRYFEGSKWLGDVIVRVSVQLMTFVHVDPDLVDPELARLIQKQLHGEDALGVQGFCGGDGVACPEPSDTPAAAGWRPRPPWPPRRERSS